MARSLRIPKSRPRLSNPLKNLRVDEPYEDVFEEMTLAEHLLELRNRVVRSVLAVTAAFIISAVFLAPRALRFIVDSANLESNGLDIQAPTDPFVIYFKIAVYLAIGVAIPIIAWQMGAFLTPGLTRKEKRLLVISMPFVSILFIAGGSYGLLFAAPRAFDFLSSFQSQNFSWEPDGNQVVAFYMRLMLGLGFAFEIPVLMFLLAKLNIVSAKRMGQYRRYAVLVVFIAAAIITPSPDAVNMTLVAAPLYALYEFGLIIARIFVRRPVEPAKAD